MYDFKKFFRTAERIEGMISFAYSEKGKYLSKKTCVKIAGLLLEGKNYESICKTLGINNSTFYRYANPAYREKLRETERKHNCKRHGTEDRSLYKHKQESDAGVLNLWAPREVAENKGLTEEEIKERGLHGNPKLRMKKWVNFGVIEVSEEGGNAVYKPNVKNPFWKGIICDLVN